MPGTAGKVIDHSAILIDQTLTHGRNTGPRLSGTGEHLDTKFTNRLADFSFGSFY